MKQKDIYMLNFDPVNGSEQGGRRPGVIISGNAMNNGTSLVILCPITSKIKKYPSSVILKKNDINGLSHDSEVLTFQVRCCSKERLTKKIGSITNEELLVILQGLNNVMKY